MKIAFPVIVTRTEAMVNDNLSNIVYMRKRSVLDVIKRHVVQNCNGSDNNSYYTYTDGDTDDVPLQRPGPLPFGLAYYGEWQYDGPGQRDPISYTSTGPTTADVADEGEIDSFLEQEIEDLHADDDLMREVYKLGYDEAMRVATRSIEDAEGKLNRPGYQIDSGFCLPVVFHLPPLPELHCSDGIDIYQQDPVLLFTIPTSIFKPIWDKS